MRFIDDSICGLWNMRQASLISTNCKRWYFEKRETRRNTHKAQNILQRLRKDREKRTYEGDTTK